MELLGRRIAKHRAELGWTQADVAARVGISRVALSHLEAGISVAGERTVAMLAGLFGCEPHTLVEGTDYPPAKAERLPLVVARYTEVEHQLARMDAQIEVLCRLELADARRVATELGSEWRHELDRLQASCFDPREREMLTAARSRLAEGTRRFS